jgi:hypothetical protein
MKKNLIKICDYYLNDMNKDLIEEFYGGNNAKIIITDINYSTWVKTYHVEAKIIIGDVISDDCLDKTIANHLICELFKYISDNPIRTSISINV